MKLRPVRRSRRIVLSLVIFITAVAVGALLMKSTHANISPGVSPPSGLAQKTPGAPQFSFNASTALGWHQGPVDKVSLAMFSDDTTCWTYIEHKPGTVDVASELKRIEVDQVSNGAVVTSEGALTLTLHTTTGEQKYTMQPFSVTTAGSSEKVYGGQEYAFFPLANGYAKIEGYCHTADQLPTITPALQALKFDTAK